MADAIQATINSAELLERVAQLTAHRACGGNEHDGMGKLHGNCVVCLVPWPCEYAGTPPAKDAELAEAKAALSAKERELARMKAVVEAAEDLLQALGPSDDPASLPEIGKLADALKKAQENPNG